jgi:hypothetical protein
MKPLGEENFPSFWDTEDSLPKAQKELASHEAKKKKITISIFTLKFTL